MTIQEFAKLLDGREYGEEITSAEEASAKDAGFIVAFGYSDDNLELRGAAHDEVGAWDGATAKINANGDILGSDEEEDEYTRLIKEGWTPPPGKREVLTIKAKWCPDGVDTSWRITSSAPFSPFNVMEGNELFCIGAVIDFGEARKKVEGAA